MGLGDKIKGIGDLVVQVHDADLKADLQQRILDLQGDCFALQEKNNALLDENNKLKAQLQQVEDNRQLLDGLTLERDVYWKDGIPYCIACVHRDKQLVPVAPVHVHSLRLKERRPGNDAQCPVCGKKYNNVFGDEPPFKEPPSPSYRDIDPYQQYHGL